MRFLTDRHGQSTIEMVLLATIIVVVLGGVVFALFSGIAAKLQEYNDAL